MSGRGPFIGVRALFQEFYGDMELGAWLFLRFPWPAIGMSLGVQ